MFHNRINRLQHLLLAVFLPLTAVIWLFQLNPAVSSAPATSALDVVVSEIAWMGSTGSTTDEWLELANNTAADVDLTGWRLVASDGTPDITLTGIIPAGRRYLLERTDDTTTPKLADQIYTGGLLNTGEVLTLTDSLDTVIDVTGAPGAWFAGDNTTKETMERTVLTASGTLPSSWGNGPVDGTPTNSIGDGDVDTFGYSPNIDWLAGSGSGYEALAEDCDDDDNTVYPGAPELLDVKDNDCDGEIDEDFVLGDLDYAVYFSSDVALTAVATTTDVTIMEGALLDLLNNANQSIDVAIYGFDRASLRDALIAAHNKGVTVRVIGDDDTIADPRYAPYYQALVDAGIPVVPDILSYLQHNKFIVIDDQITWTGSTNWTDTGFTYNMNNSQVFTDTYISLAYSMEFEEMYSGSFSNNKEDNTPHVFTYTNAVIEIYFAPTDDVETQILEAVDSADSSLQFAQFFWTSSPLGQLAVSKFVDEGGEVWRTWDQLGAGNVSSQDDVLCAAGVPVWVEDWGGKLHHKVGVIDAHGSDPTVVTGSFNWTASAEDKNDENTMIIHSADIADAYYQEMVRLYAAIDRSPCNPAPTPTADFTADVITGETPLPVTFTDLSQGVVSGWEWAFGDGLTATVASPHHVYNNPGVYTVSLMVAGLDLGDTLTKISYIMVTDGIPRISLNRTQLNFGAEIGGSPTTPQTAIISNIGAGQMAWTATASDTWLSATPLTGIGGEVVTVAVDSTGLLAGTYTGNITFSSATAINSPVSLPITLTVYPSGGDAVPFGGFDTPLDGSTVSSNIPVTGWALDDIEVVGVKIYRDAMIFLGDAAFTDEVRPDIEMLYPEYPYTSRSAWTYLLNSYVLPNGGNGTFTLHAMATDSSGNEVTLGSKTITVDNASAVKPFGAINTPIQGGTASGTSYRINGWVLTPQPNSIPVDGTTIDIYVDGVLIGHPTYNIYRSDIDTLFPGYNNSSGAGAYIDLDTTLYENGMHTIQWVATDDGGNTNSIDLHYFMINNNALSPTPIFVDDDYSAATPGWGIDRFASIQDGIDNAAVGTVVEIAPGTYVESVNLGKNVYVSLSGEVTIDGNLLIASGDFVASRDTLNLLGDLMIITGGNFDANGGTIQFVGSGIQTIVGDTSFFDVTVGNGVTVVTTANIAVVGTLTNNGTTQETKAIVGTDKYNFGLADVSVDVTQTGLSSLQVVRQDQNHPNATAGIQTGRYWRFTPVGSGFVLDMTLPHNDVPDEQDKICRYLGVDTTWDCKANGFDPVEKTITRVGITQLSDWATGNNVGPLAVSLGSIEIRSGTNVHIMALTLAVFLLLNMGSMMALVFLWARKRKH